MLFWFADDDLVEIAGSIRRRADTGTDDTSAFQMHFGGGAVAQCLVTQAASTFFGADLIGNAGRVTLRGWHWLQFEIGVPSDVNVAYSQPTVIRPYISSDHVSLMLGARTGGIRRCDRRRTGAGDFRRR